MSQAGSLNSPSSGGSGTVTSVSVVTANGFAGTVATATTTPAITLTTTATGVLSGNGTAISGSAVTQYDVLVGGASNAISSVGPGTAGQVLQSGGNAANPAYSTATFPSTAGTSGNVLTSDGTNWSSAAPTSGGISTINGDSGSITGSSVTIYANNASQNCGSSVEFVNSGTTSTLNVTDPDNNTLIGISAGNATLSGIQNCGFGNNVGHALTDGNSNNFFGNSCGASVTSGGANNLFGSLAGTSLSGGSDNCFFGQGSGQSATSSNDNSFFGYGTAQALDSGSYNLILGSGSGSSYTTSESSNILLSNVGVVGESHVMRLGTDGSGAKQVNQCFVAGIAGVTVANTAAVLIDTSTSQLGTVVSSRRFKENIQDMGKESEIIYKLRPVTFTLKEYSQFGKQTGLIAEEVIEIAPQLVALDKEGIPASVSYHELPALLLNEIQKLNKRIQILEAKIKI